MATGDNMVYVGATTGRPIPLATDTPTRSSHTPTRPKPTGLDWDAITPTCNGCGTKSGQLGDGGRCPTCRGVKPIDVTSGKTHTPRGGTRPTPIATPLPEDELLRRFTGPDDTRLGQALSDLEATDPQVAAAAQALDDATERITHPNEHVRAPQDSRKAGNQGRPTTRSSAPRATSPSSSPGSVPGAGSATHREKNPAAAQETRPAAAAGPSDSNVVELATAYTPDANLDAQVAHAERVLRGTHSTTDPVAKLLRLNVLAALEALHLYSELHLAPQTPVARSQGEGAARPATTLASTTGVPPADFTHKRPSRLDPHRDELIHDYLEGTSPITLGTRYGVSDVTIRNYLRREGIPLRNRSEAQTKSKRRHTTSTGDTTA